MKIKLSKQASLKEFYLDMEIRRASDKKDLIAYVMLAKENGGILTPNELCHSFLHNIKISVGEEILKECSEYGIFYWNNNTKTAELTPLGIEISETGVPYITERNLFDLIYLNEPLVKNRLISCHILRNIQNNLSEKKEQVSDDIINSLIGKKFSPFTRKSNEEPEKGWIKDSIEICRINPDNRIEFDSGIKLDLKVEISDISDLINIQILGEYNDSFPQNSEEINYFKAAFDELLSCSELKDWNFDKQSLGIRYRKDTIDFLKFDDRTERLTKSIKIKKDFKSELFGNDKITIEVENIPVFPIDYEDTIELFYRFLEKEIIDYVSNDEYLELAQNLREKLLNYCDLDYNFDIPDRIEFAEIIRKNSNGECVRGYWNLVAPVDLSFEGVD